MEKFPLSLEAAEIGSRRIWAALEYMGWSRAFFKSPMTEL